MGSSADHVPGARRARLPGAFLSPDCPTMQDLTLKCMSQYAGEPPWALGA
jgi:hypothetical protein